MKLTKSQQAYVEAIRKNHKSDVNVTESFDGRCIYVSFIFNGCGVYHGREVTRIVTKRGRVIR